MQNFRSIFKNWETFIQIDRRKDMAESTQPVPLIIYIVYTILCGVFLLGVKSFVTIFIYTVQGYGEAFNSVYRHLRRFLEGIRRSSVAK